MFKRCLTTVKRIITKSDLRFRDLSFHVTRYLEYNITSSLTMSITLLIKEENLRLIMSMDVKTID
jgi:hypothetical protein